MDFFFLSSTTELNTGNYFILRHTCLSLRITEQKPSFLSVQMFVARSFISPFLFVCFCVCVSVNYCVLLQSCFEKCNKRRAVTCRGRIITSVFLFYSGLKLFLRLLWWQPWITGFLLLMLPLRSCVWFQAIISRRCDSPESNHTLFIYLSFFFISSSRLNDTLHKVHVLPFHFFLPEQKCRRRQMTSGVFSVRNRRLKWSRRCCRGPNAARHLQPSVQTRLFSQTWDQSVTQPCHQTVNMMTW